MATMPRVRQIEEMCRQAQIDPRLTSVVCMLAERQRVQHQQIMEIVTNFGKMMDLLMFIQKQLGIRDDNLKRLGVEEMMKNAKGVSVESVEEFDADTQASNELERKGN